MQRGLTTPTLEIISESPDQTALAGAALAGWLRGGDVILLHGDLGAGKTTLAKGIAAALQVDAVVTSPSFALVNEYKGGLGADVFRLYHLDLYRLHGADDLASIGYEEYIAPVDAATMIEWPERAAEALPDRYLLIEIEAIGEDRRRLRIAPYPPDDVWSMRMLDLWSRLRPSDTETANRQGQWLPNSR